MKKNGKANGKRKAQRSKRNGSVSKIVLAVVPKELGFTWSRVRTNIRFTKSVYLTNLGGVSSNIRFTPTNAFDIDPTVGSTAAPGFAEWAALYRYYRTNSSSIQVDFGNQELFPATAAIIPVNFDPGANHSGTVTVQLLGQPSARVAMVGPLTGNSTKTLRHSASTNMFGGARNLMSTDEYSASVTAGPTNNWHWDVIFYPAAAITAAACLAHVTIDICLDFYELNAPSI